MRGEAFMDEYSRDEIKRGRVILKSDWEIVDNFKSDQKKGVPAPSFEKPYPENASLISLPVAKDLSEKSVGKAIADRMSRRKFTDEPITLEELSFLLWATQGVKRVGKVATLRTVPSAGARHPFETYLYVRKVEGLNEGIYRYLPLEHALILQKTDRYLREQLIRATLDQVFIGDAAVVFIWAAIPYRTEWRYGPVSHKVILIDAGHVCENLYLSCESINLGTCAVAAYSQKQMDEFVGIDGEDEFVVYLAPVGKVPPQVI